jgi:hypothetical protein
MIIRPKETFAQKFKETQTQSNSFGSVETLKFQKNEVYQFFIIPKVSFIDIENDVADVDYPFEEVTTHFGVYEFVKEKLKIQRPTRVNCKGSCAIEELIEENRVPKHIYKMAVGTKFFLTYVIHEKRIKVAWFQDYLYSTFRQKLSDIILEDNINLIDAFRHKIKLYTNEKGYFDIEIDKTVVIPSTSEGFKQILKTVHEKPLETFIENEVLSDKEYIYKIAYELKKYYKEIETLERRSQKAIEMEERSKELANYIEAFKNDKNNNVNEIFSDEQMIDTETNEQKEYVGPYSNETADDEDPF